jgi:UDP:flavonoid glycosyltransferase YjiC (YdhE family)
MRALAHDLPLLVLPLHPMLDQPMIGKAVAAAGAGLVLPATASPDRIGSAIRTLHDDPAYRTNAARLGGRIRATTGAATATDRLEVLLPAASDGLPRR